MFIGFGCAGSRCKTQEGWIARHQAFWTGAVEQLDRLLSEDPKRCERKNATPKCADTSPQRLEGFSRLLRDAHLVSRWLSPSPEIKLTLLQFDFRVGGRYRFAYHLPDGTTVIVGGVYRSIEPPSTIVFSWIIEPPDEHAGIESEVTVTIAATVAAASSSSATKSSHKPTL